jgi:molybdopterin synthase sulfur carrier subunit
VAPLPRRIKLLYFAGRRAGWAAGPVLVQAPLAKAPRRIKLLYFAALKERLGRESDDLVLPPEVIRVADLPGFLPTFRPLLHGALGSVRIAVGDEFAAPDRELVDGDVVALLPPVSGG